MLGAAYMLTRSLWLPMGLHAGVEFHAGRDVRRPGVGHQRPWRPRCAALRQPLLTGGGFGLEASVIAIVIATGFGLWLLWLAIRKGEVVKPMWARRRDLISS